MRKFFISLLLVGSLFAWWTDTIWVPMQDSILLVATVYFPDTTEHPFPRPVLLQRTPYGREVDDTLLLDLVCDYFGYIIFSQNLRGRYESQGEPLLFITDGWGPLKDGYTTIEWINSQDFCNGKIGMVGASAPGMTQYYAAGAHPPSLDCIVPIVAAPSLYHHCVFPGGEFRKALSETWLEGVGTPWLLDTIENHPSYDSMWSWVNLPSRWDSAPYPMFHISGWFDLYTDGQLEAFSELQKRFGQQKLFVGPWGHGDAWGSRQQGDLVFPPNAELDEGYAFEQLARWYNYFLLDDSTGILEEPPVRFYLMGDCDSGDTTYWNRWIEADTWPLPCVSYKKFYLREGGLLDTLPPTTNEPPDVYSYDPLDPTPTIGGREYIGIPYDTLTGLGGYGPRNQNPIESRPDVLIYETLPLQEPMVVLGKIKLILFASSDRLDTDFAVRVCDVYPDGRSILMTDGILKARYRHGFDHEDLLTPGLPDTFIIDAWSTANVFNTGHKLRIIISSSNFPRFERNPNTGAPFKINDTLNTLIATNTVYHQPDMPSYLEVPIAPFPLPYVQEKIFGKMGEIKVFLSTISRSPNLKIIVEERGNLSVEIYDVAGRRMETLYKGKIERGIYTFKPSTSFTSGNYFIRVEKDGRRINRKIVVLK